jgi:small subunit ribosomal protein S6e
MFKINIASKDGKTYKLELETEEFIGKSLHDKIQGKELLPDLADYEFEIAGTSDKAGFTSMKGAEGVGLKKVLLTYGKGMKKRPKKEGKKKRSNSTPKGLRLRKTVRGRVISPEITQINLKVTKAGAKPLAEVFPDQNKAPEPEKKEEPKPTEPEKKTEAPKEKVVDNKDISEDKTIEKTNDKISSENITSKKTPSESETKEPKPEEKNI